MYSAYEPREIQECCCNIRLCATLYLHLLNTEQSQVSALEPVKYAYLQAETLRKLLNIERKREDYAPLMCFMFLEQRTINVP